MRSRIFLKLLLAFAVVIAATVGIIDILVRGAWEKSLRQEIERNLTQKTLMFARRVDTDRSRVLQNTASEEGQAAEARATIIDPTGKVLADSEAEPSSPENYAHEKEFEEALKGKIGSEERRSEVGTSFLYIAAPISGGAVRLAYPLSDLEVTTRRIRRTLLISSAIAFGIALIIAGVAAQYTARRLRRILAFADRIAAGDLTARIAEGSDDEIGHLAAALDRTARTLEQSFAALQNSRHELETLLNSMQDGVIAISPDGRVQWANRSMDRLLREHVRLQAPVVETVRDPDFLGSLRGAADSNKVVSARAASIIPGRSFEVTAAPMPDGGAVAVLRDLTETERVEKTRRDFIANVSHELRTPLTSIQGYAETLLDNTSENNHTREFLEIIRKNATRMARLTEDLLTLARVESGEQHFEREAVPAEELLEEAAQNFREVARNHGIELLVENSANQAVAADREAIHQVFSNLVDNALKYGAKGGRIVLGARPGRKRVEFYVRDFGGGISSEHLPRLFERFYRVDKARSRESGGTGLGLAIAKHIVLAHGGTIRAESELNHGSTFLFTLPTA